MKQEIVAQIQAVRNELDALTYMLYEADEEPTPEPVPMASDEPGEYLTVQDLARQMQVSPATIYRWARAGIIPKGTQWGPRTRRWSREELGGGPLGH